MRPLLVRVYHCWNVPCGLSPLSPLSSASAFVAPRQAARPLAAKAVPGLVGETAPTGFFDPLGFSQGKTLEQVRVPDTWR